MHCFILLLSLTLELFFFSFSFLQTTEAEVLSHTAPEQRLLLCKPTGTGLNFKHALLFYPALLLFATPGTQPLLNGDAALRYNHAADDAAEDAQRGPPSFPANAEAVCHGQR